MMSDTLNPRRNLCSCLHSNKPVCLMTNITLLKAAHLASSTCPKTWQGFVQGVEDLHHQAPAVAEAVGEAMGDVEHGAKAVDVLRADACESARNKHSSHSVRQSQMCAAALIDNSETYLASRPAPADCLEQTALNALTPRWSF